jgi:hypothetical protein
MWSSACGFSAMELLGCYLARNTLRTTEMKQAEAKRSGLGDWIS